MQIKIAETDSEIQNCFNVMLQLRPHLSSENFLKVIRDQMKEGYLLAFLTADGEVKSVAGFRLLTSLSAGYHLYVDDFVSSSKDRSKGFGSELFDWLVQYGRSNKCKKLRLDSGVQRYGAHRFYLRKGMDITCHHFDLALET